MFVVCVCVCVCVCVFTAFLPQALRLCENVGFGPPKGPIFTQLIGGSKMAAATIFAALAYRGRENGSAMEEHRRKVSLGPHRNALN